LALWAISVSVNVIIVVRHYSMNFSYLSLPCAVVVGVKLLNGLPF
jgi:hypothetical protein